MVPICSAFGLFLLMEEGGSFPDESFELSNPRETLKEWKVSIFKIVDQRIKCYSQNTNLLPPKPKSTSRHLNLSKTFIESMFWFQQTRPQTTLLLFDGYTMLTL